MYGDSKVLQDHLSVNEKISIDKGNFESHRRMVERSRNASDSFDETDSPVVPDECGDEGPVILHEKLNNC